jgi:hypothetical protein
MGFGRNLDSTQGECGAAASMERQLRVESLATSTARQNRNQTAGKKIPPQRRHRVRGEIRRGARRNEGSAHGEEKPEDHPHKPRVGHPPQPKRRSLTPTSGPQCVADRCQRLPPALGPLRHSAVVCARVRSDVFRHLVSGASGEEFLCLFAQSLPSQ